jgi:hypothetical protein
MTSARPHGLCHRRLCSISRFIAFQAFTVAGAERGLADGSAAQALSGDALFFKQLSRLRVEKSDAYPGELRLKNARRAADAAWHDKGYAKVVELIRAASGSPHASELKKLSYARQHLYRV